MHLSTGVFLRRDVTPSAALQYTAMYQRSAIQDSTNSVLTFPLFLCFVSPSLVHFDSSPLAHAPLSQSLLNLKHLHILFVFTVLFENECVLLFNRFVSLLCTGTSLEFLPSLFRVDNRCGKHI